MLYNLKNSDFTSSDQGLTQNPLHIRFTMKLQVSSVLVIVGLISTIKLSSCLSCCNRYVVLTEATDNQTVQGDNCVCYSTLSKLTELESNTEKDVLEVLFQPGVHFVQDDNILAYNISSSLLIRGENKTNTTIKCLNQSKIIFKETMWSVKIQNILIHNCTLKFSRGIKHLEIGYSTLNDSGILFSIPNASILIQNTDIANHSLTSPYFASAILHFIKQYNKYCALAWLNITLQNLNFVHNTQSLLRLCLAPNSTVAVTITGTNNFTHNKNPIISLDSYSSVAVLLSFLRATVQFIKNVQRDDNIYGLATIYVYSGGISFEHSHVIFNNNIGGIRANDRIVFCDNTTIHFVNNTGLPNGGALSLYSRSSLIFNASMLNILLNFTKNNAQKGGAIYVQDGEDIKSVFNFQGDSTLVSMVFSNNSALFGGNNIYGGWIDWFRDKTGKITENNINNIVHSNNSDVASDPVRICLCENNWPNCSITNHSVTVYGNIVSLDLVAVGQRYTPIAAFVRASLDAENSSCDEENWKHLSPRFERVTASCTKVIYKLINVEGERTSLQLQSDLNTNYCADSKLTESQNVSTLFQQLSIAVTRLSCPLGFHLDETNGDCKCNESKTYELTCDLTHTKVNRTDTQWIGKTYEHTIPDKSPGIITYSPCPLDYCRTDNESLSFHLEDEDVICNFNRGGILCGGCKTNFSRVLGSSKCKICSNNIPITVIILLGQIIFGPVLVISLMMLDMTVAVGTINGLTFYANIIQTQHMVFFTHDTSASFLSTFIAWLNLNYGIEMCLFDGLDEYVATWLKLPLPFYIWSLAAALIVLSKYSFCFAKLIRKNTVQVLATLFLISHTRSVRIIIDVFSYASLTYPDGYIKRVWLVDGNVEYFKGKHIPLFLITILYVVVTLPYTIVLLSIQFLHKISHYRVMFWVQKLKPLFDAYTGPYKAKHRYWTGLLLLVRIILLIIFIYFQSCDSSVNLLAITASTFILVGWSSFVGGVYVSSLNNFLESLFLCNLGITSAAVLYDKRNTKVAVFISTSVTFITIVFIILGHALKQLLRTKHGSMIKERFLDKLSSVKRKEQASTSEAHSMSLSVSLGQFNTSVTSTTVELKEPLLEDDC